MRLRRGKKQEKTAKFSYSEEESNSEGEYTTEEPDVETVEQKKRAAGIPKDALPYRLKYTDISGRKTSRNIEIIRFFKKNGHLYFYAFFYTTLKVFIFCSDRVDELSFDGSPIDNPSQLLAEMAKE